MTEEEQMSLDNWDAFMGHWIKADLVSKVPAKFIVIKVRSETIDEEDHQVVLTVNYNNKKWDFGLNKTNTKFLKEEAKLMPKDLINKVLVIVKDKVYNPSLKKRVDGLFIDKVE